MHQRHLWPSMGAIRHSLRCERSSMPKPASRAFHMSPRRLEESSKSSPSNPDDSSTPQRENRRTRSQAAYRSIAGIQSRRPLPQSSGLAGGVFPSGQRVETPPKDATQNTSQNAAPSGGPARPLIRRTSGPARPAPPGTMARAPPPGKLVRAPATLRVSRAPGGPAARGPVLRGRDKNAGSGSKAATERAPKRREKGQGKDTAGAGNSGRPEDVPIEDTLSDATVQHLLRLQRKEWDRVPYEPKYAHGSPAAMELIEAGKKLFEGEKPVVKKGPSRLERKIGIAGMYGV
ncbi:hypothetical protein EJ04DRAFT_484882 [Polyplosphaeria fusca]|uniref:Uncharacterized protein n=1 Tax=Polyplosphaeria fusca TaxID=682080 RepID=A0A9P4RA82_9PLEO|nr:hypothetical protein EJ04DRAFT_484882 [Polyplosphaeria fusca]